MKQITILAVEKCMTSAVAALHDIFSFANLCCLKHDPTSDYPFFSVEVATEDGKEVQSFNNLSIRSDYAISEGKRADVIIIPPVLDDLYTMVDSRPEVISWLQNAHREGALLASVCTGSFFYRRDRFSGWKILHHQPHGRAAVFQPLPGYSPQAQRHYRG